MAKLLFKLAAISAHCNFGNLRARLLGDVGMKKSEPDWIYTATIFAIAAVTVCVLVWGPQ